jgi:DNA-binding IclR family transcriptional regulator
MTGRPHPGDHEQWTFLTNHARLLLCVAECPDIRIRELAEAVGITERAAFLIISDLEDAGYIERERVGRRNRYTVHPHQQMRHPLEREHTIGDLLESLRVARDAIGLFPAIATRVAGEAPA